MQFKIPKNTKEFYWTEHSVFKMRYYALSAQKILHVIKKPERKEGGIVKNTIAVMQPVNPKILDGKKIWKQEVWAMYQKKVKNLKIISAWRYPGVSPKKDPIPDDILAEIKDLT
jgi:hypothetical protein